MSEAALGPAWFFRAGEDGKIESKIFEDGVCPEGWVDSPAAIKPAKPKAEKAKAEKQDATPAQTEQANETGAGE